ncbi:MAG: flagellar motor switch protein FliN [Gammaproteobacteria bacterium]
MADTDTDKDADVMDDWAAAMAEAGAEEAPAQELPAEEVSHAGLQHLQNDKSLVKAGDDEINLDVILDIPVTISMEIGQTKLNIRNLLQLNQGSVIELDRLAGEPLDVLVNGTLIAHGEVVVVNEKFGIRLTDVISPAERVKKLG